MSEMMIEIEGSGKHCHLTRETQDILFGKDFELDIRRMLTQPGQFVAEQRLTMEGPRGSTELSIVGPCRKADQVELSFTDARSLGFDLPIRESGDVAGSPGCKLIGPEGEVEIKEGVIVMKRHVHLAPADAERFGIKDKQIVKVKVVGERALIFDEVLARTGPDHATYMHIDYDEINAAAITAANVMGEIII
ncbi:MAG: phosphate propanoyltransferase [Oscillospiraceae bacterium]|nr:phosphate propanoyltransferase [Oscillospiraceae bacterium]